MARAESYGYCYSLYRSIRAQAAEAAQNWVGTWTASPQLPRGARPAIFSNQTIRQIVHVSVGGNKLRIRLSNENRHSPCPNCAASVGLAIKARTFLLIA
jgi:hypothetical protein